jgi:hypothetical protein
LFGAQDWEFVALQQNAIEARLAHEEKAFSTLEDFQTYVSRRASALTLTAPRPVKVKNPDWELNHLLRRLVGSQKDAAHRVARVSSELEALFEEAGVDSKLRRDVVIHPPSLPRPFRAPFAYQNGRLNLIEPMQFEGHSPASVFNRASVQAVEGQFLADYRDPAFGDLALVVVAKFSPDQARERETAGDVFQKHGVPMFSFGELAPLIEEIRQHAH